MKLINQKPNKTIFIIREWGKLAFRRTQSWYHTESVDDKNENLYYDMVSHKYFAYTFQSLFNTKFIIEYDGIIDTAVRKDNII